MKKVITLFLLIFSVNCFAISVPVESSMINPGISKEISNPFLTLSPSEFIKMNVKDVEKLAGRKLKLKERLAFKILQYKTKKGINKAGKINYSKRSKTAFVLGLLSLATIILIPVSVTLAVTSIVLASKSLKEDNEDKKAKAAMGLSILSLGIIVVGLMIYGIFVSNGAFKLFTIG